MDEVGSQPSQLMKATHCFYHPPHCVPTCLLLTVLRLFSASLPPSEAQVFLIGLILLTLPYWFANFPAM